MADREIESETPGSPVPNRARVPADRGGIRLDQFLAETLAVSRAEARKVLDSGRVDLDGSKVGLRRKGLGLAVGSELTIRDFRPREAWTIIPESEEREGEGGAIREILAEGPGWIAVDKRARAPVHPLREDEVGTVLNRLVALHPQVQGVGEGALRSGVVHRLDVDTSGVLLVATEQETWERLRAGFREHRMEKTYLAIVDGTFEREITMEVGLFVAQHRPARVRVVDQTGSGAIWNSFQIVRPLEALGDATLVEIRPRTGFLHQIRATLAHVGHPVLGDRVYGNAESESRAAHHQLHASAIRFEEIDVESPIPADFARLLESLRSVT